VCVVLVRVIVMRVLLHAHNEEEEGWRKEAGHRPQAESRIPEKCLRNMWEGKLSMARCARFKAGRLPHEAEAHKHFELLVGAPLLSGGSVSQHSRLAPLAPSLPFVVIVFHDAWSSSGYHGSYPACISQLLLLLLKNGRRYKAQGPREGHVARRGRREGDGGGGRRHRVGSRPQTGTGAPAAARRSGSADQVIKDGLPPGVHRYASVVECGEVDMGRSKSRPLLRIFLQLGKRW